MVLSFQEEADETTETEGLASETPESIQEPQPIIPEEHNPSKITNVTPNKTTNLIPS